MRQATRKKTFNLNEEKIEHVRRLFGVKTETEAINRALDRVIEEEEIQRALESLIRKGRFRSLYR